MSELRYLAVYYDTNGVGRLVGQPYDFATKGEAEQRVGKIEKVHKKPHKVDYRVIPYERGKQLEAMSQNGVFT
jgi:hypothetical protein